MSDLAFTSAEMRFATAALAPIAAFALVFCYVLPATIAQERDHEL
jgi:hypothetical protein